jgi:NAD(P)-dependent dehydrogenase (short-subunit alcohol dehydrogenase family)
MTMSFAGRVVMVTGAAGALGRAVVAAFDAERASLVLVDRDRAALERAFGADSERVAFAPADLLDAASARAAVDLALRRFGRLDALVNLAGGFAMGEPVHALGDDTWQRMFDLNVRTLLNAVHAAVPPMLERGGGKVVNVGAFAAQKGAAKMGAYVAAKASVIRLTESMAAELREQGINVNCVLPTVIDTPANRADMPKADASRWVAPEAVADVIVFLASDRARAIHGAALPVTGLS